MRSTTRLIRLLLESVFVCLGLLLCTQSRADQADTLHLVTMDYPPYIFRQDGLVQGPVVNVIREAFRRIGRPVTIEMLPWSRSLAMVTDGSADGLFTIKKTEERSFLLLYPAEPVLTQEYVLFVRQNTAFHFSGDLASLENTRLGITANNSYGPKFDQALRDKRFRNLQTAYDHEHLFRMLVAGRIDVAICSRSVGVAFLRDLQAEDQITIADPPVTTAFSYLVFTRQRNYATLAQSLDRTLVAMRQDGTLARLLNDMPRLGTNTR